MTRDSLSRMPLVSTKRNSDITTLQDSTRFRRETRESRSISSFTLRCVFLEWDVHYPVPNAWWRNANSCRNPRETWRQCETSLATATYNHDDPVILILHCRNILWIQRGNLREYEIKMKIAFKELVTKMNFR